MTPDEVRNAALDEAAGILDGWADDAETDDNLSPRERIEMAASFRHQAEVIRGHKSSADNGGRIGLYFAAEVVYQTFATDLRQGFRTRDKEYAVRLLGKALGRPTDVASEAQARPEKPSPLDDAWDEG